MKTFYFLFFALFSLTASAQCYQDTLQPFVINAYYLDSEPIECYTVAPDCDACHYWQLPSHFQGAVFLYAVSGTYQAVIFDSCRYVLLDTVVTFGQSTVFSIHANYPEIASLMVCGVQGKTIDADMKPDPSGLLPNFGPRRLDIDTLCPQIPTAAPEPVTPQPIYFDLERLGVPVLQKYLQPNRSYKLVIPK